MIDKHAKKNNFSLNVKRYSCHWLRAYHLDEPLNAIDVNPSPWVELRIRGWILSQGELYIREAQEFKYLPFNKLRVDVQAKFASSSDKVGFDYRYRCQSSRLAVGIYKDGIHHELWQIRINTKQKIIKGKDNWLFLDNDTNRSVDQHRGRYLLNTHELALWKAYLDELKKLADSFHLKACVLIVPSKEKWIEKAYPYPKADTTPN